VAGLQGLDLSNPNGVRTRRGRDTRRRITVGGDHGQFRRWQVLGVGVSTIGDAWGTPIGDKESIDSHAGPRSQVMTMIVFVGWSTSAIVWPEERIPILRYAASAGSLPSRTPRLNVVAPSEAAHACT
jgi:hypothetical protein